MMTTLPLSRAAVAALTFSPCFNVRYVFQLSLNHLLNYPDCNAT